MKYWTKKQDEERGAYWFAKVPKTDDGNVDDGRFERHWKTADRTGSTWGWSAEALTGIIEAASVETVFDDLTLTIRIEGGNLLQWKMYENKFIHVVNSLGSIDLSKPVTFHMVLSKAANKYGYKAPFCLVKQNGGMLRPKWPWNDSNKAYDGLPAIKQSEKFGQVTYDAEDRNRAFDEEIEEFIAKVESTSAPEEVEESMVF